jgi:hypothetical protein
LLLVQVRQVKHQAILMVITVLILFLLLLQQLLAVVAVRTWVLTVGLEKRVVQVVAVHIKTVIQPYSEVLEPLHKGTMVVKVLLVEQQVLGLVAAAVLVQLVLMGYLVLLVLVVQVWHRQ